MVLVRSSTKSLSRPWSDKQLNKLMCVLGSGIEVGAVRFEVRKGDSNSVWVKKG